MRSSPLIALVIMLTGCGQLTCREASDQHSTITRDAAQGRQSCDDDADCTLVATPLECGEFRFGDCGTPIRADQADAFRAQVANDSAYLCSAQTEGGFCGINVLCNARRFATCEAGQCVATLRDP